MKTLLLFLFGSIGVIFFGKEVLQDDEQKFKSKMVFNVSDTVIGVLTDVDNDQKYDKYFRIQMPKKFDTKKLSETQRESFVIDNGYIFVKDIGKFYVNNEKYRLKYKSEIESTTNEYLIGIAEHFGEFKVENNKIYVKNIYKNENARGPEFTHIDDITSGGGGSNCDVSCSSGGPGATACSVDSDLGPIGSGCSVDCSDGKYACCNANIPKCCCK